MKTNTRHIIYGILAILPFTNISCTERALESRPAAVRLYTDILARTAVDKFDDTPVCIARATSPGVYAECWDGIAANGEITLVPARYYPADGTSLCLRGYYPPAPIGDGGVVTYTLTGKEDLMASEECTGSRDDPFSPETGKNMIFKHLLAKLSFIVEVKGDFPPGFRLRELSLEGLASSARVTLRDGTLVCEGNAVPVPLYSVPENEEGLLFDGGSVNIPGTLLVQPGAEFTMDIMLSADSDREHDLAYPGCPVEFEEGEVEGGKAYRVKIVLPSPDPEIQPRITVTVIPWESSEVDDDLELNPAGKRD